MGGSRTKDLKYAQKYSKGSNILKREKVTGGILNDRCLMCQCKSKLALCDKCDAEVTNEVKSEANTK